ASFRFEVTLDTLAFGYILPTTGRIRDFNPLETCAARRTIKGTSAKTDVPYLPNKSEYVPVLEAVRISCDLFTA
ncbi:hypothetical protein, partial [Oribacterium sp.]